MGIKNFGCFTLAQRIIWMKMGSGIIVHSAKGLDGESVLVLRAHELERKDEAEGRRLLYIAMTRARSELYISYSGESALVAQLEKSFLAKETRRLFF